MPIYTAVTDDANKGSLSDPLSLNVTYLGSIINAEDELSKETVCHRCMKSCTTRSHQTMATIRLQPFPQTGRRAIASL